MMPLYKSWSEFASITPYSLWSLVDVALRYFWIFWMKQQIFWFDFPSLFLLVLLTHFLSSSFLNLFWLMHLILHWGMDIMQLEIGIAHRNIMTLVLYKQIAEDAFSHINKPKNIFTSVASYTNISTSSADSLLKRANCVSLRSPRSASCDTDYTNIVTTHDYY